jgi:hypothetical protein
MRKLGWIVFAAGCTSSPPSHQIPSASITPHLDSAATDVACGEDIALNGAATPDLRYTFGYDASGLLVHADGAYAAGGANDSIDYGYDAADNFTHMLETRGFGDSRVEITADYDSGSHLLDYTWDVGAPNYHDNWAYNYSGYTGDVPTREVVTEQGQGSFGYTLVWDATGRLAQAVPDTGPATNYTYDDAAGTLTIDTNAGAWHGVISYDPNDFRELGEVWGGTDPSAVASQSVWAWNGEELDSITYTQSGYSETDSLRYTCAAARAGANRPQHLPRAMRR